MKYILMMNIPKAGYAAFGAWTQRDVEANVKFVKNMNKTLSESGEFVAAEGLALPDQAKTRTGGQRRSANHRWRVPGIKRISSRLLDR